MDFNNYFVGFSADGPCVLREDCSAGTGDGSGTAGRISGNLVGGRSF